MRPHLLTMFCFRLYRLRYWQREPPFILSQYAKPRIYLINLQVRFFPALELGLQDPRILSHVEELPKDSSLSSALVTAIHSRKTTSDVTHILSHTSTSADQVADTLYA